MITRIVRVLTVFAAISAALVPAIPANAQPPVSSGAGLSTQSMATQVEWRGRRGYWRGHRGGNGVGIGLGVAGALLGGAIIANEARGDEYYDGDEGDGVGRCAATFRSFNPATGTYTGYDGIVRPCPYL